MARNDQVDRQWYLIKRLEGGRSATLQELVDAIPEDFPRNPRTIRRDLEVLERHWPLVTEQIDGQTRWKFREGYTRTLPVTFSTTELMALLFSRNLLKPLEGTLIKESLDSAFDKAAAVLPPSGLTYLGRLQGVFSVGIGPHKSYRNHQDTIDCLTQAIDRKHTVQMRYYTASRDQTTRREVDPYRLWYMTGGLYLIAYCHNREDVLLFAVERIRSLTVTDHPYQMPLGFDLETYMRDALVVMRGKQIEVELLFGKSTAPWVKDRIWHSSQRLTPVKQGSLKMSLRVADTQEFLGWILSFGSGVQVLKPRSLREKVIEEAKRIALSRPTSLALEGEQKGEDE